MDRLTQLAMSGVFIHLGWDHYFARHNLIFSIESKLNPQTLWYGDNGEFGDTAHTYDSAMKLGEFLIEKRTETKIKQYVNALIENKDFVHPM